MTAATASHVPPPTPLRRNLVFGAIAAAIILGWVGDAVWGSLVGRSPLLLLLINAKFRYLILVVNELDPWVFYPAALVRLLITKPLLWLVGAWYGPRLVDWIETRFQRIARAVRWLQRHFPRYGWMVMIATTANPVCLLAGSVGYPLAWLMVWAVIGTLIRLWAIDLAGAALAKEITAFSDWVGDHRVAVVAASITLVLVLIWWQRRRGVSPLDELQSLEDAVEASAAEAGVDHGEGPVS